MLAGSAAGSRCGVGLAQQLPNPYVSGLTFNSFQSQNRALRTSELSETFPFLTLK